MCRWALPWISRMRGGVGRVELWGILCLNWSFWSRTTDNLNKLLPFSFFFSKELFFLQIVFVGCWPRRTLNSRTICYTAANSVGEPFNFGQRTFPAISFGCCAEVHFWDLEANSTLGAVVAHVWFGESTSIELRSSFPTPTYAITKMCANEERGLASLAWRLFCPSKNL